MTTPRKNFLAACALLTIVSFAGACSDSNNDTPTNPTNGPAIASISPSAITAKSSAQVITVTGTNFGSGASLILKGPGTGATLYGPSQLTTQTDTAITANVVIAVNGAWTATVRNSAGTDSAEFAFTVGGGTAGTNPQILSVSPSAVVTSASAQTITVSGNNFGSGLSLIVRDANGGTTTLNGGSISNQTSTSFKATVIFQTAGTYTLVVRNADNLESGAFALVVVDTPIVTSLTPASITASASDQTIDVFGAGFQSGLSYVLKGPDTGAKLYGPSDVTFDTSSHFRAVGNFPVAGDWTITIINPNGVQSAQFAFSVQ